jgi:type I pantothenate kinase
MLRTLLSGNLFGDLANLVASRLDAEPPHLIGISGAVAVGKSTIAEALAGELVDLGRRVQVVATDAFLFSNATLAERDLTFRKGFPETFDLDRLAAFLRAVPAGEDRIEIPVYSHVTYDLVPGAMVALDRPDLVIVEGVVVLQPAIADLLDVSIYIDADEADVRRWFVERFVRLTDAARDDPDSFYNGFVYLPPDQLTALAEATWDGINGVNLREHIFPTRERAQIVIKKSGDHSIRAMSGLTTPGESEGSQGARRRTSSRRRRRRMP